MTVQMTPPRHHPDEAMLLDYTAGSLHEPFAIVVATHLALCAGCRDVVARLEAVGGALFDDLPAAAADERALDALLRRLDDAAPAAVRPVAPADDGTPTVLRAYLPGPLASLRWKQRTGQLATFDVLPEAKGVRTRLLRISAGASMPRHTHGGDEFTLVLTGAFADELGQYGRGDLAATDSTVTHRPVADAGEDCVCLAVTNAPLRLTGALGFVLNRFQDF